jgi:hypothetical protein
VAIKKELASGNCINDFVMKCKEILAVIKEEY